MSMTRKHFEAIASALAPSREHDESEIDTLNSAANRIALELQSLCPNFNKVAYLQAAGHRDYVN